MNWAQDLHKHAAAFRRFNRLYMAKLQPLRDAMRGAGMTAAQMRVLRELGKSQGGVTAAWLATRLRVGRPYLSRILSRLRALGYLEECRDGSDRRRALVELSRVGREAFGRHEHRAAAAAEAMLLNLCPQDRQKLVEAMQTIESILHATAWELAIYRSSDRGCG